MSKARDAELIRYDEATRTIRLAVMLEDGTVTGRWISYIFKNGTFVGQ
jgi:hypothetical protein